MAGGLLNRTVQNKVQGSGFINNNAIVTKKCRKNICT